MGLPSYPGGVWLVDFEFHPAHGREGNPPAPVCMVAREIASGRTLRLWQDELARLPSAPFPTDASALFVAYYAPAEMSCFIAPGSPARKKSTSYTSPSVPARSTHAKCRRGPRLARYSRWTRTSLS